MFPRLILLVLVLPALCGCATYADHLVDMREEFYAGNLESATLRIDRRLKRAGKDADVLKLERGMIELCSGRPQEAERLLREVRDQFDHLEQQSLGETTLAMLTDDNRLSYAGEDYEKVLVRAMLAISNLMHDGGDARAYSLQVTDKQNQVIETGANEAGENPKLAYKRVALGAYLHGALCEETHHDFDDVTRARNAVVSWQPDFRYGQDDLQRAVYGRHSEPGNGVLYVFAFVGEGPYKEETIELPSTVALLIADRIISNNGEHTLPPTIAPIKVPKVIVPYSHVRGVQVSVSGQLQGTTETVTDVGQLAVQQYEAVYPQVLARAVVRRVVKKGVVYGAKEVVNADENKALNLAMDAAGVIWEGTEAADTRCWGLLPAQIQVLRIELPEGEHRIGLAPVGEFGVSPGDCEATVNISNGRNTYMLANFPRNRLVGKIVTSGAR